MKLNFVDTVYHGVDTDRIRFHNEHEDYALFVGRLVREKGLHTALEATKRTRVPFRIASTFTKRYTETQYYKEHIHPYMDSPRITRYSVISRKRLYDLYKRAKMLLFPIEWEEPFGMVMLEAMASGTPVIAYNRGSVSEIVRDGVTGFVVDESADKRTGEHIIKQHGIAGMCEAIRRIGEIDRAGCRRYVEEHFGIAQTTQSYEAVYRSLVSS